MIRLANFMPKLQQQILVTDARLYGYHSLSMSYEVIMLSYSEMWGRPANQGLLQNTHTHLFNGPFSETTRVGRYQKGKTISGFYWSKKQWVAVASAGPHESLHLTPDR